MKKRINLLGFLSLLALISVLALITKNQGWLGFLGFLYYLRYFWVIPDEAFIKYVEKSASLAFFTQTLSLIPFLFILRIFGYENCIQLSFGICFSMGIFVFTLANVFFEWKESKGISYD
ncbi:MAG: DUF3796 domain-containing protein [Clostridia bacterium]|nr:DUF3796 domain-containing protein [Clostridiales bacterium]MDU1029388.1 DUF3796 domain-containing protein [Clostridiales bacterium]MDU2293288.1 DUF3796 domain-containing protein [Peptococcus niger]MDU7244200.1 DUF3796 domain-containing protein [Clostridiales bacterium]MDU7505873.1 DUF3796 domain-containing protein [Clostridia bacterium]